MNRTKEQMREELTAKGVKTTSKMTKAELTDLYEVHLVDAPVKSPTEKYEGYPEK